jgi:RND family efflux transporter MFP subunit
MMTPRKQQHLLAACAAAILTASCGRPSRPAESDREPEPVVVGPEDTVRASVGQVLTGPVISGEIRADESASVRAQLAGPVQAVHASEGDRVTKGQVLARINAVTERDAVASAETALRTAQYELSVAGRDAERIERLVRAGALAERDLEQARSGVAAARARLADAQARLTSAREQLGNAVVRAPMRGIVSESPVNAGDVVAIGAPLFTIIDPSTMELAASVAADNLSLVRPGTPVRFEVQGYPGRTFSGRIERISPAADPDTKQVTIFVSIPNQQGTLVAGLYAEGRIATGRKETVVVPARAVVTEGETAYVVKLRNGQVERQSVQLGVRDERTGEVEIVSGVRAGELLLAGPALEVAPGTPVEVRNTAARTG